MEGLYIKYNANYIKSSLRYKFFLHINLYICYFRDQILSSVFISLIPRILKQKITKYLYPIKVEKLAICSSDILGVKDMNTLLRVWSQKRSS